MKESLRLLDEIIEMEKSRDAGLKELFIRANKASLSVGESAVLAHLKNLKELMILEISQTNTCSCGPQSDDLTPPDKLIDETPKLSCCGGLHS